MYRPRTLLACITLVLGTSVATAAILDARQDRAQAGTQEAGMAMDPAMMDEMMKLAAPGPEHKELMAGAGNWNVSYKLRMAPEAPWMEASGTMKAHSILDGRYLIEEQEFTMMGMPMKGVSVLGYDNSTGEYTSMWADTMSTWWIHSRGKKSADGSIDYKGTMKDIAGERPFRMLVKAEGPDKVTMHMFDTIPPQGEVEVMVITATRAK